MPLLMRWGALFGLWLLGSAQAASCGMFGLTVNSPAVLTAVERKVGCTFTSTRWFVDWNRPFPVNQARALFAGPGRQLELSWQPRLVKVSKGKTSYVGVPYRVIAAGGYDAYVRRFARDVRATGRSVAITFAPEMNGDWGVYQLSTKNTPQDFKRAWVRLHRIFRQEKANVRWIWAPNILYPTARASYGALYPGDAYVDEVGLDGYNWGTTHSWNRWKTFAQTFDASYRAVKALTGKPIQLGELSSVEQGGNKAQWIRDMCRQLPHYPRVRKVFWFHVLDGKVDWRLTTSSAALKAFQSCVKIKP
ncbi:glycoside hydrolase family 26 protein [Deinococcus hohokamensis]|uniref:Glycoside hydrolase family 26 protein n=1 Tax=Deinococcus hohokamensis TaxID=309883 RepID=A0ABV9I8G6_9DEIO